MRRWLGILPLLLGLVWTLPAHGQGQLINGNRTIAGAFNFCVATGSANTYTCVLNPAITAYLHGQCFLIKVPVANTGPATVNINGLGAKTFKKWVAGVLTDLSANDIGPQQLVEACYDTTQMQVMSLGGGASGSGGTGTITAVGTCTTGNCFTATTPGQSLFFTTIPAPGPPDSGSLLLYNDIVHQRFHDKNPNGIVGTTVVADPGIANQFLTGIGPNGFVSKARPDFANLTGTLTPSQTPAYTGDVTKPAGSTTTTLAAVNATPGTYSNPTLDVDTKGRITTIASGTGFESACTTKIVNANGVSGQDIPISTSPVTVLSPNATLCEAMVVNTSSSQALRCRGPEDSAPVSAVSGLFLFPGAVLKMGTEARTGLSCIRDITSGANAAVSVMELRP